MDISLFRERFTRLNKRLRQEAQNHPDTWSHMLVLSAIDQMNGTATPSKIVELENIRSSNLASLLKDLEARNLIIRKPDTEDRRRIWIELSEQGRTVLQASRKLRDEWLSEAVDACLTASERKHLEIAGLLLEKLSVYGRSEDH